MAGFSPPHGIPPLAHPTLHALRDGCCADGTPWTEVQLSPARTLQLAQVSRCLHGAGALLQLLHAAHVGRQDGEPAPWLDDFAMDGLLHASRELLECAGQCLVARER